MSYQDEYNDIYFKEILQKSREIVFPFSPVTSIYQFQPYAHGTLESSVEDLAELMRNNLFFYTFGEDEVVKFYKKDQFHSMELAAKYAYRQRLPKRADITDGLPSEVLLDLLIQLYSPNAYKLAVRTLYRQNDNFEIKGYDLTYFTKDESGTTLWLGQSKLGTKDYCKSDIDQDLLKKYTTKYLTDQLFFLCDKPIHVTEDAKELLSVIEDLNIQMMNDDEDTRATALAEYLKSHNIKIKIPCLLAYGANAVYRDAGQLYAKIQAEVRSIQKYFIAKEYRFEQIAPEIVFCIFPIESIERLRDKETGFYAGLCE